MSYKPRLDVSLFNRKCFDKSKVVLFSVKATANEIVSFVTIFQLTSLINQQLHYK